MAITDNILKPVISNPIQLPTMEDLQSVASPFSIIPTAAKQRETPVPIVQQSANSWFNTSLPIQVSPEQNAWGYVNPFAWMQITPYQPLQSLQTQPVQFPNQWVQVKYGAWEWLVPRFLSSVFWTQQAPTNDNQYNSYLNNQSELEKVTEQYKLDTQWPIGKAFTTLNNAVFWVWYGDLAGEIKSAQNSIDRVSGMKASEPWVSIAPWKENSVIWSALWLLFPSKGEEVTNAWKSQEYLSSIKSIVWDKFVSDIQSQDKRLTDSIEQRFQANLQPNITKALFPTWSNKWIWNAAVNFAEVWTYIRDTANSLSVYQVNLENELKKAQAEWNIEKVDRIQSQINTNIPTVVDKLSNKINWTTDYKNSNPEASDWAAESAYNDYLKWKGYRNLNAYMLEWIVDRRWEVISKEKANEEWVYWVTFKDEFNYINNVNENSVFSNLNTVLSPASLWRLLWSVLETARIAPAAATADLGSSYWIEMSNTKKTFFWDNAWFFRAMVTDKWADTVPNIFLLALTEWAWNVTQLKKLSYVEEAAKAATAVQRVANVSKRWLSFLTKTWLKEIAQNAFIDSSDPNATSRSNQILNLYGSFLWMWMELWQLSRETWLLNSEIVRKSINNRIRDIKVDEIAEKQWVSRSEAQKIFESLPTQDKWFVSESEERLASIQWLEKLAGQERARVLKAIDEAPESEKAIYIQELNKLNEAEKNWVLEQALVTKLYSDTWLDEQQARTFARLFKDAKNPQVMVEDIVRILKAQTNPWARDILAWAATDIARTGWIKDSWDIIKWNFVYKDGGTTATYVNKSIWISPDSTYSFEDLTDASFAAAKVSKNEWTNILNSIMAKEWQDFKYFDDLWDWRYVLSKEWLDKLNVTNYNAASKIQREVIKSWWEETFIKWLRDNIADPSIWISESDVSKLESSWAYAKALETIDTFIPC